MERNESSEPQDIRRAGRTDGHTSLETRTIKPALSFLALARKRKKTRSTLLAEFNSKFPSVDIGTTVRE